jgi:hypothetical protein
VRSEASYTAEVLRELRLLKPAWIVVKNNDRITAGIPDAFVCRDDGRTLWIEVKRSPSKNPTLAGLRLSSAQALTLGKMRSLGVPHLILVRTPERWKVYGLDGFQIDLTSSAKEVCAWLVNAV